MEWQFNSDAPIYTQLVEQLTLAIVTGAYQPGQRLPAVRELAVEAGVNPNTMQRALSELERSQLVYSMRTSGRFVTEDGEMIKQAKDDLANRQIRQFLQAMGRLGYEKAEIMSLLQQAQEKGEI